jgi:hypothetical protein
LKHNGFGHDMMTCIAARDLATIARLTGDREILDLARSAAAAVLRPGQEHVTWGPGLDHARSGAALLSFLRRDLETAARLRAWYAENDKDWIPGWALTTSRIRGLLDLTLGNVDAAVHEFEHALEHHAAQRPGPNVAWICSEVAEALLMRRAPGDIERAAELLRDGVVMARSLGMLPLQERLRLLAARVPAVAPSRRASRATRTT